MPIMKALAGPAFIAIAAANIYVPGTGKKGTVRQVKVVNVTAGAVLFTLYRGATGASAAGTQISPVNYSVPANDVRDIYFTGLDFSTTQFLTGVANAATSLVIVVIGSEDAV